VNEFLIHLRKDLKLLTSDSMFVIFLLVMAVASFIIALSTCAGYVQGNTYGSSVVTRASLELAQKSALVNYWSVVGGLLTAMLMGARRWPWARRRRAGWAATR